MAPPRSLYNPGTQPLADLERIFVARHSILDDLTDAVDSAVRTGAGPNVLLVGSRGSGKTHLLTMARHRLVRNAALRPHIVVAWLREEERGVSSYVDWLYRIVESLARHDETPADVSADAAEAMARWLDMEPEDVPRDAERFILRFAGERRIVLLVENLGDLFSETKGLGRNGQARFRDLLQDKPQWTILATTQGLSPDLADSDAPFFGFFRTLALDPLNIDQTLDLLRRLADADGDERTLAQLATPRGARRARALHRYAGGNPRLVSLLYEALVVREADQASEAFSRRLVEVMDDVTTYYQERLSRLPPLQEKILTVLGALRFPAPVKDIARHCFTTPQSVSPQLARLLDSHLVRRTPRGRESYYELAEPMMRLLFECKENRGLPSKFFVDFLAEWHTAAELRSNLAAFTTASRPEEASSNFLKTVYQLASDRYDLAEPDDGPFQEDRAYLWSLLGRGDGAREAVTWFHETQGSEPDANGDPGDRCVAIAGSLAERISRGAPVEQWVAVGAFLEEAAAWARESAYPSALGACLDASGRLLMFECKDRRAIGLFEECLAISRETGDRRGEGINLGNLGNAYARLGETAKAIEHYEAALNISRETGDPATRLRRAVHLALAYHAANEPASGIPILAQALQDHGTSEGGLEAWAAAVGQILSSATREDDSSGVSSALALIARVEEGEAVGILGSALLAILDPRERPGDASLARLSEAAQKALGSIDAWSAPLRLLDAGVRTLSGEDKEKALLGLTLEERQLVEAILAGSTDRDT